jgi:hypothetical protein
MKTLHFSVRIEAPPALVWKVMLADDTYRDWTSAFCEGSYFEGSWDQGSKMRFLAPGGEGMVTVVAENRTNEFVSLRHIGVVKDGVEDTSSEAVRKWAPSYENYTFNALDDGSATDLRIDMDIEPQYEKHMADAWPKALARLKSVCEAGASSAD